MAVVRIMMLSKEINLVPTQNTISKSGIKSAFLLGDDSIISLKYKLNDVEIHCDSRTIRHDIFDPESCFLLPDGWKDLQFILDSDKAPSRPATPTDLRQSPSPYPEAPSPPPPLSKSIDKWMFYAFDAKAGKSTVVCIHPRYCVTFRHGTHLLLQVGSVIRIFHAKIEDQHNNVDGYEVTVVDVNDRFDFVLLRCNEAIVQTAPRLVRAEESEIFLLAGFGDTSSGSQQLAYLSGIVHSVRGYYFSITDRRPSLMGPFYLGTGQSSRGDSGGACFSARGLIGINYGVTAMGDLGFTHHAISEAATYSPKNLISPAERIEQSLMDQLSIEQHNSPHPPPSKRRLIETETEGIGHQTLFIDESNL